MTPATLQFLAFILVACCWMGLLGVVGSIVYGFIRLWRWADQDIDILPERFL